MDNSIESNPTLSKGELQATSWIVAGGRQTDTPGHPLNVPIIPASNFILQSGETQARSLQEYSRNDGTQSWDALESVIGGLEGSPSHPAQCTSFSSGMGAISAVMNLVPCGGHIIIPTDCYGGTAALAALGEQQGKWTLTRLDSADTTSWLAALHDSPSLLWLESVSNPLLEVADVSAIGSARKELPESTSTLLVVDATFVTPLHQKPLSLGADISIHSATKFIGGHSDLLSGVASTHSTQLHQRIRQQRALWGATPGALESFLCLRGIRTLALRFHAAQRNAQILAERLAAHPGVSCTRYPGYGAVISFDVKNGGAEAADNVCAYTQLIHHATSLGAVESTMERRAKIPGQDHLPPTLLRLSVGIEDVDDLWRDLLGALEKASAA